MKKTELVYREIAYRAMEKKEFRLTQSELSKNLGISLSIINLAVKKLEAIGALKIGQRSFHILDIKKVIYFWASYRNLGKDIVFKTRIEAPVREIERAMPGIFTAYTAYKIAFNDVPADYSEVYVYADEKQLEEIKKRASNLRTSKNKENFFVLKKDSLMDRYKKLPLAQLFVDLWNLKEWYAKEYLNAIEEKIFK